MFLRVVVVLFLSATSQFLLTEGRSSSCQLIWDQSRPPFNASTYNPATAYSVFRQMMSTSFGIGVSISTVPLDVVDYDGVGILWMEGKHSNFSYPISSSETQSVFDFVQSGGSLLLQLDGPKDAAGDYALQLLSRFQTGQSTPSFQDNPPIIEVFDPETRGPSPISMNVSFLASNGQGERMYSRFLSKDIVSALRANSTTGPDLAFLAQYYPRGRVVILWDTDVLDDPFIGNANNTIFAQNILSFLSPDCTTAGCQGRCGVNSTCFKDFCFCDVGWTGDNCTTAFSNPCEYTGGCISPPQNCSDWNPVQCLNGACTYAPSACPAKKGCFNPTPNLCIDGSCRASGGCLALGASCSQIVCSDGSCVPTIADCPIVPACPINTAVFGGKPFRCPGGQCVALASQCPTVAPCTNVGDQLCLDGVCRPECPRYDGCSSDFNPYLCSNYICAANQSACAQCGNGSASHELCWDGACACLIDTSSYTCTPCSVAASFNVPMEMKVHIPQNQNVTFPVVEDADHTQPVLRVSVPAGTFSQDVNLVISRIPLGNLRDQIGEFATTCLSSIVDLAVSPDLPLQQPIGLAFVVSPPTNQAGVDLFNVSLNYLNEQLNNWSSIYFTVVDGYIFVQTVSSAEVASANNGVTGQPAVIVGSGTTHFTPFSVLLGSGNPDSSNNGDGGDGNLSVILPAVLVPVAFVVVVVVIVSAALGSLIYAWHKRHRANTLGTVNFSSVPGEEM